MISIKRLSNVTLLILSSQCLLFISFQLNRFTSFKYDRFCPFCLLSIHSSVYNQRSIHVRSSHSSVLSMNQRPRDIEIELKSVKLLSNRELKNELNTYLLQSTPSSSSSSSALKQQAIGAFDRRDLEHVVAEFRVQIQAAVKADALQYQRQKQIEAMQIRDEIAAIEKTCTFRDMIHELKEEHAMEFDMIPVDDKHMVATYLALARLNLTATHHHPLPHSNQTKTTTTTASKAASTSSNQRRRRYSSRNDDDGDDGGRVTMEEGTNNNIFTAASAAFDDVKTSVARYGPQVNMISNIFDVQTDLEKLIKQRKKSISKHQHQHEHEHERQEEKKKQLSDQTLKTTKRNNFEVDDEDEEEDEDNNGDIDAMINDTITTTRSRYKFTTTAPTPTAPSISSSSATTTSSSTSFSKGKSRSTASDSSSSSRAPEFTDQSNSDSENSGSIKSNQQSPPSSAYDDGDDSSDDANDVYRIDNRIYFPGQQSLTPRPSSQDNDITTKRNTRSTEDEDIDDNNDDESFIPTATSKQTKNTSRRSSTGTNYADQFSQQQPKRQKQRVESRRSAAQVESVQFASELIMKSFIGTFLLFFRQFLPWTTITSFAQSISSLFSEISQNLNFPSGQWNSVGGWGIHRLKNMALSVLMGCERFVMTLIARLALWSTGSNKLGSVVLFVATSLCILFRKGLTWFILSFLAVRILRIAIFTTLNGDNNNNNNNYQSNNYNKEYRNSGQDI